MIIDPEYLKDVYYNTPDLGEINVNYLHGEIVSTWTPWGINRFILLTYAGYQAKVELSSEAQCQMGKVLTQNIHELELIEALKLLDKKLGR